MSFERLIRNIEWKFASKNHDDDFHTDVLFLRASTGPIKKFCGHSYEKTLLFYEDFSGEFYYPNDEAYNICNLLKNKFIHDYEWASNINNEIVIRSDILSKQWNDYEQIKNFHHLTDKKLFDLYEKQLAAQNKLYEAAWIPEILQDLEYGISNYFCNYLELKGIPAGEHDEIIKILSSNHGCSVYKKELSILLQLADTIKRDHSLTLTFKKPYRYLRAIIPSWIKREIFKISNEFGFLWYHGYDSRNKYEFEDYIRRLSELVNNQDLYLDAINSMKQYEIYQKRRAITLDKLSIDSLHEKIFHIYGEFAISKAYRRLAQLRNFYFLDILIEEIALRLNTEERVIRFMRPEEVRGCLDRYSIPKGINERSKSMLFMINGKDEKIWTGHEALDIFSKINFLKKESKCSTIEITGSCVCVGCVQGKAVVIKRASEILSINYDDPLILVSVEADPDLSLIMRKMSAIITDQGGITCHAAIIAREFNIPCVIGTQYATKYISDGDWLEVDADKGHVKIIRKNNLLKE